MFLMRNIYKYAILTLMVLAGLVSCERELGVLAPAPFPTDAEVYTDAFGPSVEPQSFSGTKLDALQTTDKESYLGTSAIEITIPGPGDPSGSTWSGGALVAGGARDLTGYNALTFYAKASKALTLNTVGIGNDNEAPTYAADIANLPITTSWMQYTIPIPLADKLVQEKGMFYYSEGQEDGEGATIWLDEIQFESLGTIAHPSFSFASDELSVYQNATVTIPAITVSHDVDGSNIDVNASAEYLTYTFSNDTTIVVEDDGSLTAAKQGHVTIYGYLGDTSVSDSLMISVGEAPPEPATAAPTPIVAADSVVSIYSDVYTAVTTPNFYTYWEFSTTDVQEVSLAGDNTMQFLNLNFAGIDFSESDLVNATGMTHFHMDVWTPDASASPAAFKILLVDFGPDGDYGGTDNSSHELSITASSTPALVSDEWMTLDIPLSAFTGLTSKGHIAQLVISGDPNTVYLDNIYFRNSGELVTPPAGTGPATAAPTPSADAADVVSIFSDVYTAATNPNFYTYWDGTTTQVEKQTVAGDTLMRFTALNWAGIDLNDPVDASAMTHFHADVWTPDAVSATGSFKILLVDFGADGVVGGSDNTSHEISLSSSTTPALATDEWAQLDIALSAFSGLSATSNIGQLVISGEIDTVYMDNIYFYEGEDTPPPGDAPSSAAPTPTAAASDVVSIFSEAYTAATEPDFYTYWDGTTTQVQKMGFGSDSLMQFTLLNWAGIDFHDPVDATGKNYFHMDIWTPDPTSSATSFKVLLVNVGADGVVGGSDDSSHEISLSASTTPALASSEWVQLDIPMALFSGLTSTDKIGQLVISGDINTVYLDNIYFVSADPPAVDEPSEAAPTPSLAAGDVISLFSNAYTDVTVDNWATGWQWSTAVLEEVQVAGDDVKLYTLLNFNGIEFTTATIDASAMTHFHMDIWTPDATGAPADFKVKLIDFGANGSWDGGGDDTEHELTFTASSSPALATAEWVSIEVPLSSFTGLTARGHLAQMVISGSDGVNTVYVDNIYFHK